MQLWGYLHWWNFTLIISFETIIHTIGQIHHNKSTINRMNPQKNRFWRSKLFPHFAFVQLFPNSNGPHPPSPSREPSPEPVRPPDGARGARTATWSRVGAPNDVKFGSKLQLYNSKKNISGWCWLSHPSEKYESQLGWFISQDMETCSEPPTRYSYP